MISLVVALANPAQAAWPEDVTLSGMTEHGGLRVVDNQTLSNDYKQLISELGSAIANKPMAPAETLGASGFDFSLANTFVFYNTENDDGTPTPWERAHVDEDPAAYMFVPELTARKGLPFSLEAGANIGWIGNSRTGLFGGFARMGLVEGYKPAPDLTVQVGYSGYVGNDELEVGALDFGATLGSTFAFGTFPGINQAQFHPYLNFSMLRITAAPLLSDDLKGDIGAVTFARTTAEDKDREKPLVIPRLGGGFQITNGTVLFRLVSTWAPSTVPTVGVGMGFSY